MSSRPFQSRLHPVLLGLLLTASVLPAEEVVVQNDSLMDFGQGFIQVGFGAGESAAAWLASPCVGDITKVLVLWRSQFGGAPDSLEDSITVFEPGAFPAPGTERAILSGPIMVDGPLNEFTLPVPLPIQDGDEFVVSFKFLNDPPQVGPSVVTDADGCQVPKNAIFAIPPSAWFDACALGVSGDFVIRAVVDCDAGAGTLTIFPPTGSSIDTASHDLGLIAEIPAGVTVVGLSATLNGQDASTLLDNCLVPGTLVDVEGLSFRCKRFDRRLVPGANTLSVTLDFSNGTSASDTVTWEVFRNTEP